MVILWFFIGLTAQQSIDYGALGELTDEELTGVVKKTLTIANTQSRKPYLKHFITLASLQTNYWMTITVTMILSAKSRMASMISFCPSSI